MNRLDRMLAEMEASISALHLSAMSPAEVKDKAVARVEDWSVISSVIECIRRGYKPVSEVDVRRDCTNCAHLRAVFGPNLGFVDTVCDVLDSLPDDYEELIERDACPMWEAVE